MGERRASTCFSFSDKEMPVRFGRHMLISRLATDPIGEEFLALWGVDEGVDQLRVVRCIYPAVAEEAEFVALFSEESRALSRLSSDNVVRIMEVGTEGEIPFVAREHVEGLSLDRLIDLARRRQAPWPWELAAHVASEMLRGLDYVHTREDIHGRPMSARHGDVRPGNVLVSYRGEVKLTNFGSALHAIVNERTNARLRSARGRYAHTGSGSGPNAAAEDLWGVALALWSLLAGQPPPEVADDEAPWVPPTIAFRVESMPGVLDAFLARALNPDPAFRFEGASAMREALIAVMGEHVTGHPPDDLAAWAKDLGHDDREREARLVRDMLGQEAHMSLAGAAQESALGPGTVLDGRYHIIRRIGEGGMGQVFEAEHLGLTRRVAVKVLHDIVLGEKATVERFRREARITGSLGHPNIVGVSDFGVTSEGWHYLVMDLLEGEPLSALIRKGPVPAADLVRIMAEVCDGLEAAHQAGVIHRDLKPDNIVLTPGGARILDFGIAKRTGLEDEEQSLTKTGHICGTVDYISPEQIRGTGQDGRSDIYAAGVILYEGLTGRTPFRGRTVAETLHKVMHDKLVPPRRLTGDRTIPAELEAVCMKALSRHAERRYKSAVEMSRALRALLPQRAGETVALSRSASARRFLPWLAAAVIAAIAATVMVNLADPASKPSRPAEKIDPAPQRARVDGIGAVLDGPPVAPFAPPVPQEPLRPPKVAPPPAAEAAAPLLARADEALRRMRLDEAVTLYAEALRADPASSAAIFGMGRVAFEQGRFDEAVRQVETALAARPGNARFRNFLGQVFLTKGDKARAIAQWKRVLMDHPDDREARKLLAAADE
ncbi:MAG: protein kinase [Deltaproteobacteria bacterium]|nr:protein kinase [Deltaproteobacteria bacterium]